MAEQNSKALATSRVILPNRRDPQSVRQALSDRLNLSEAIEIVGVILDCYPNGGRDATRGYIGALAAVLAQYPRCVTSFAGDPHKGVPRETRFLPTPADVIAWCEREVADLRGIVERDDYHREIRERMKRREEEANSIEAQRKTRPTLQQMKDKYGENWGITSVEKEDLKVKAARQDMMARANTAAFEAECRAAGIDPNRVASPSLERLLHGEIRMRKAEALGREIDRVAAGAAE